MKPSIQISVTEIGGHVPVRRGRSNAKVSGGVDASRGTECQLCHFGCTQLAPEHQAACHLACDLIAC